LYAQLASGAFVHVADSQASVCPDVYLRPYIYQGWTRSKTQHRGAHEAKVAALIYILTCAVLPPAGHDVRAVSSAAAAAAFPGGCGIAAHGQGEEVEALSCSQLRSHGGAQTRLGLQADSLSLRQHVLLWLWQAIHQGLLDWQSQEGGLCQRHVILHLLGWRVM
jgi:hypothetical protein